MRPNIEERAYLTETELKELMTHKFDNDIGCKNKLIEHGFIRSDLFHRELMDIVEDEGGTEITVAK